MKTKINNAANPIVVTAANEDYSLPLAVMLKSIEVNIEDGVQVKVYVLNSELSQRSKSEIERSIDPKKIIIHWKKINPNQLKGLKVDGHISIDTYYRLLIERLFPHYDKVIYLDADLLLNRSVNELWNLPCEDKHLLAVPHASVESGYVSGKRGIPAYKFLGIPEDTITFNAGVMVINLKLWRQDLVSDNVLNYIKKYKAFVLWWDQDGLNALLYNKWRKLPPTWNVITSHLYSFSSWEDSLLTEIEYKEVCHSPAIIHFAGPSKPWRPNYEGPFQEIFIKYVNFLASRHLKNLCFRNTDIFFNHGIKSD